jgi:hypothetical protein
MCHILPILNVTMERCNRTIDKRAIPFGDRPIPRRFLSGLMLNFRQAIQPFIFMTKNFKKNVPKLSDKKGLYFMLDTILSTLQYCKLRIKIVRASMALSELEKKRVERLFSDYCRSKIPHHVSDRFEVIFELRGQEIKLLESRPDWRDGSKWVLQKIARFRKEIETNLWHLYYCDSKGRWCPFEPCLSEKDIEKLLHEVERDSYGRFWG